MHQIVQREGVRALWKGNGVTMLHRLPYSAVNFWAYEQFTKQWQHKFPNATKSQDAVLRRLAAGGAAGMLACTLVWLAVLHLVCMHICPEFRLPKVCMLVPCQVMNASGCWPSFMESPLCSQLLAIS